MSIQILQGDLRSILPTLASDSVDCIMADPPYGETSLVWDHWPDGWPSLVRRVLKKTGSMWVFGSFRMFLEKRDEFEGWRLSHEVVWEKHNGSGLFNDRFRRVHELAAHFYRDDAKWGDVFKSPQFTHDARARIVRKKGRPAQWIGATGETIYKSEDGGPRLMRSVISVRSEHGRALHPTQKPIGVVEPLLRYSCRPGALVLDPFAGSGTTGIVAREIGCSSTLIELNPEFVEIARRRIASDVPLFYEAAE